MSVPEIPLITDVIREGFRACECRLPDLGYSFSQIGLDPGRSRAAGAHPRAHQLALVVFFWGRKEGRFRGQ